MEDVDLVSMGDRIRGVRGTLRQADFAERLGVDRQTIGRYESGKRPADVAFLYRLVVEFGVDAGWLITGREPNLATSQGLNDSGERSNTSAQSHLSPKEQVLLDEFRAATEEKRKFILAAAMGFAGTDTGGRSKARVKQTQKAAINTGFMISSNNESKKD